MRKWYDVEYLGVRHGRNGTWYRGAMTVQSTSRKNAAEFVKDILTGISTENEWLDFLPDGRLPEFAMDNRLNENGNNWKNMSAEERYAVLDRYCYRATINSDVTD